MFTTKKHLITSDVEFLNYILKAINDYMGPKRSLKEFEKVFILSLVNHIYAYAGLPEPILPRLAFHSTIGDELKSQYVAKVEVLLRMLVVNAKIPIFFPELKEINKAPTEFSSLVIKIKNIIETSNNENKLKLLIKDKILKSKKDKLQRLKNKIAVILSETEIKPTEVIKPIAHSIVTSDVMADQKLLEALPPEMIEYIASFFDLVTHSKASQTCLTMQNILNSDRLWKHYLLRDYAFNFENNTNISAESSLSPKEKYKRFKQDNEYPKTFYAFAIESESYKIVNDDPIELLNRFLRMSTGLSFTPGVVHQFPSRAVEYKIKNSFPLILADDVKYYCLGFNINFKNLEKENKFLRDIIVEIAECTIKFGSNSGLFMNVLGNATHLEPKDFKRIPVRYNGRFFTVNPHVIPEINEVVDTAKLMQNKSL